MEQTQAHHASPAGGAPPTTARETTPPSIYGLAIMITVLGFNTVGDWLRDILDPRSHLRNA